MASLTPRIDRLQKNYIINGDMRIAQRGTSFAAIGNTAYSLDRWRYAKSGAMIHTLTQDTDVPTLAQSGYLFQNSLRLNLTTPDTAIAAGDYCLLQQFVEGYNWANLAQKDCTLSFWVKATTPGIYSISLRNIGTDRSFVGQYTIDAADVWEKKTINIPASPSAGTWNYVNGIGVNISWALAGGSTYQTTPGSWAIGDFLASPSQSNGVNTGATDFRITGVCLYEGELEDPAFSLFNKDFEGEIAACRRYYEKSYDLSVAPGTASATSEYSRQRLASSTADGSLTLDCPFQVRKRAFPLAVAYSPVTGASGTIRDFDAGVDRTAAIQLGGYQWGLRITNSGLGYAIGNTYGAHYTADAEL